LTAAMDVLGESIRLIQAHQEGDPRALDSLMARYYDRVERIVRARTGPWLKRIESVEDLVQETFLAAVQSFDRFELREDASLIQWLAKLAEHRIVNAAQHHRREKRDRRREVRPPTIRPGGADSAASWQLAAESTEIPERVARAEVHAELEECLHELPELQRETILLRSYAGGSWAWVAEELGLASDEAARKVHARARTKLATLLQGRLGAS